MASRNKTTKSSDIKKPTEAQLKARAKFAEQAKARGKAFTMTAKINDKIAVCKTNDLAEAIESLGLNFPHIKTRLILKVEQGGKSTERVLFVNAVRKLFKNKFYRNLFVRKLVLK